MSALGFNDAVVRAATKYLGVDSTGLNLPPDLEFMASTFTRDGSGNILTEARTNGTNTWTQTYTRDSSGNISAISQWVRT